MRGHKLNFYRLKSGTAVSFFLLSEPLKYEAHFITEIDGTTISKKNCHGQNCPFCASGVPLSTGVYVIIAMEGSELSFFDITKAMYREMSKSARSHCQEFGEEFSSMGAFLSKHLVTVIKLSEDNRTFSGYEVSYTDLDEDDVRTVRGRLLTDKKYKSLMIEMPDLVRPGTPEEDMGDIVYA